MIIKKHGKSERTKRKCMETEDLHVEAKLNERANPGDHPLTDEAWF